MTRLLTMSCFLFCFLCSTVQAGATETRHHALNEHIKLAITTPKHVKNNNLAGIKTCGIKWEGLIGTTKQGYAKFKHPSDSVRATAVILKNYSEKYKINTISGIVNRYCASGDKKRYIAFLSKKTGIAPNQRINILKNLHKLLPAIIQYESGTVIYVKYV